MECEMLQENTNVKTEYSLDGSASVPLRDIRRALRNIELVEDQLHEATNALIAYASSIKLMTINPEISFKADGIIAYSEDLKLTRERALIIRKFILQSEENVLPF